jgi:hypothetical protein
MEADIDPGVASLFGGRLRAVTLGALASAQTPLTAYRIAKITGSQVIKVITELRRLEATGVLDRVSRAGSAPGWTLTDPALRDFFRRRVRIVWWRDWDREVSRRVLRSASLPRTPIDLSRFRPNPRAVPNREEFVRPPEKDRELARAGLPISRRTGRRR